MARPTDELLRRSSLSPGSFQYRAFPSGLLPKPVCSYVRKTARSIGCDESFLALPTLAALAASAGNTRRVRLKATWQEPCCLWAVIIGPSGTLNSPAFRAATGFLRAVENRAVSEFEEQLAQYQRESIEHEVAPQDWKANGRVRGEDLSTAPSEPTPDRYVVSDTTFEGLVQQLAANPRGLLLARDELSAFLASFNAYRRRGHDAARFCELFHGTSLTVDRKGQGLRPIFVQRGLMSIAGGVQPEILARFLSLEHFENGLAARLLMAMPPRRQKKFRAVDPPEDMDEQMTDLFQSLLSLDFHQDAEGGGQPIDLPRSARGLQAFEQFYNRHGEEHAIMVGDAAAAWSKLEAYAARLALLVHLVRAAAGDARLADPGEVDAESVAVGVQLVEWFKTETLRVYDVLSENGEKRELRRLVELIRTRPEGKIKIRELQRSRQMYGRADDARHALQTLQELGLGGLVRQAGTTGGRPTEVFYLDDQYINDKTFQEKLAQTE